VSSGQQKSLLHDIAEHARIIRDIRASGDMSGTYKTNTNLAAALYHFIAIGEAARDLGNEFHRRHPQIPWTNIIAHRNVIAHGYKSVSERLLLETIDNDLPSLITQIEDLLDA